MTRRQLEAVHDALAELIDSINDAGADEDRGRSNDALCLTIFDDGSGRLGCRKWFSTGETEDWSDFDNFDQLVEVLKDQGVEIDEENAND